DSGGAGDRAALARVGRFPVAGRSRQGHRNDNAARASALHGTPTPPQVFMHRFYAFVGLVLTFEAPHITPPRDSASPPPRTSPRDSLAVRGALERWVAAWNSKNLEGMLATWSADAVESFPARSRAFPEIRASYEEYVSSSRTTRQSVEFQRIGTSGDLAFSEAIWSAVDIVRDSLGPHERPARHSRSLEIWQRQPDGRWLIVRSLAFGLPGSVAASSQADWASRT